MTLIQHFYEEKNNIFSLIYPGYWIYASVNWVSIGSDNGLAPGRRQAIILTNADIFTIRLQGTYFNEILFEIQIVSFKKMHLNKSSVKWQPFCPWGEMSQWVSINMPTHAMETYHL